MKHKKPSDKFTKHAGATDAWAPGDYNANFFEDAGANAAAGAISSLPFGVSWLTTGGAAAIGALTPFAEQGYFAILSDANKADMLAGRVQEWLEDIARLLSNTGQQDPKLSQLAQMFQKLGSDYKGFIDVIVAQKKGDLSQNSLYNHLHGNNPAASQSSQPANSEIDKNTLMNPLGNMTDNSSGGGIDTNNTLMSAIPSFSGTSYSSVFSNSNSNQDRRMVKTAKTATLPQLLGSMALYTGFNWLIDTAQQHEGLKESLEPYIKVILEVLPQITQYSGNNADVKSINQTILSQLRQYLSAYAQPGDFQR